MDQVMKAPRFEVILDHGAANDTVFVVVGTADKKKFELSFSRECAHSLTGLLGAILASNSQSHSPQVSGIQTAMKDDGSPALLLNLGTGAEIALGVTPESLAACIDELTTLLNLIEKRGLN